MKTKEFLVRSAHLIRSSLDRKLLICAFLTIGSLGAIGFMTRAHDGFVAHEWGTFTSVQGGDGVLLDWRPLESSKLPGFVYNWQKPGLKRVATGVASPFTKASLTTLQRMETPVIYFYTKESQTVDVIVDFPKGLITEWYPQAIRIGPSFIPPSPAVAKADELVHKAGAKPTFTFASLLSNPTTPQSRAQWQVEILRDRDGAQIASSLLTDKSGSHYFAARETDANFLEVNSLDATNPAPQHEKFLFYRGAGNFPTPLHVTMTAENTIMIANTGEEPLLHLFVLGLENQAGNFVEVEQLAAGESKTIQMNPQQKSEPVKQLAAKLGQRMAEDLVCEGLYQREANAMVNTWQDSWFEEDGLRVLYVLPRAWTDRTLPLKMEPAPKELVRVMVGRAEVLTPKREQQLSTNLTNAHGGDKEAAEEVLAEFKRLGRFAQPALQLALKGSSIEVNQTAWKLYVVAGAKQSDFE